MATSLVGYLTPCTGLRMNFHVEAFNPAMDKNNIALHVASKTGMCLQSTFHSRRI